MKQDIRLLPSPLERYEKKATPQQGEYGFIAQDVLPLFPDLVITARDP
jgi:hypothetical protein